MKVRHFEELKPSENFVEKHFIITRYIQLVGINDNGFSSGDPRQYFIVQGDRDIHLVSTRVEALHQPRTPATSSLGSVLVLFAHLHRDTRVMVVVLRPHTDVRCYGVQSAIICQSSQQGEVTRLLHVKKGLHHAGKRKSQSSKK